MAQAFQERQNTLLLASKGDGMKKTWNGGLYVTTTGGQLKTVSIAQIALDFLKECGESDIGGRRPTQVVKLHIESKLKVECRKIVIKNALEQLFREKRVKKIHIDNGTVSWEVEILPVRGVPL